MTTRIIIHFFVLTSLFAVSPVATALAQSMGEIVVQENDGTPPEKKTLSGAEKPAVMGKPVTEYPAPVPQKGSEAAPDRPDDLSFPAVELNHMGGVQSKKPAFGLGINFSTHLTDIQESAPPVAAEPAKSGPPAPATGLFSELRQTDTATVEQVIDPLRIRLKDGRIVQLTGIDIPDLDPYEPGDMTAAARDMLEKLLKGKQVRLYQTRNQKLGRLNRLGYPLVHMALAGDESKAAWAQGTLIAAGLARVRPSARNPEMAAQMITLEDKARNERAGMWTDLRFAALTPETAASGLNGWVLIQGKIHGVATVGKTVYLNFGPDWRTDFTIALDADVKSRFIKAGIDPMALGGKTVRARGWLRDYNGPFIELLHPAWMQVLKDNNNNNNTNTTTTTDAVKGDSQ